MLCTGTTGGNVWTVLLRTHSALIIRPPSFRVKSPAQRRMPVAM
jgi:hypothetical protein